MNLRHRLGLLAAAVLLTLSFSVSGAPGARAETQLPPCAPTDLIFGMATKTYANGDFKVVITPARDGRGNLWETLFPRDRTNDVWHQTQACVPGLYGAIADTIYAQISCHVMGGWAPGTSGSYMTGGTWDLESWHPLGDVRPGTVCGAKSSSIGDSDPLHGGEQGDWHVYFGSTPLDMIEDSNIVLAPETSGGAVVSTAPYAKSVSVAFTGGQGLHVRTGPSRSYLSIGLLAEGTPLTLLCQTRGEMVAGTDWWDRVRLDDGREAFASDAYVYTGADGQIAPTC